MSVMTRHIPSASANDIHDLGESLDFRPQRARRLGIGMRHAGRIEVAVNHGADRADEFVRVEQRHQFAGFARRDFLELDAEIAALGDKVAQPVHPGRRGGQHDAAGQMHAGRLAGKLLDLLVEADRVFLQLGDVRIAIDRVHAAGGMPCRAGCQLVALQQHHIAPTVPRKMEQHGAADHTAANHYSLRMRLHELFSLFQWVGREGGYRGRKIKRPLTRPPLRSATLSPLGRGALSAVAPLLAALKSEAGRGRSPLPSGERVAERSGGRVRG